MHPERLILRIRSEACTAEPTDLADPVRKTLIKEADAFLTNDEPCLEITSLVVEEQANTLHDDSALILKPLLDNAVGILELR
jgi:hypothetical protein